MPQLTGDDLLALHRSAVHQCAAELERVFDPNVIDGVASIIESHGWDVDIGFGPRDRVVEDLIGWAEARGAGAKLVHQFAASLLMRPAAAMGFVPCVVVIGGLASYVEIETPRPPTEDEEREQDFLQIACFMMSTRGLAPRPDIPQPENVPQVPVRSMACPLCQAWREALDDEILAYLSDPGAVRRPATILRGSLRVCAPCADDDSTIIRAGKRFGLGEEELRAAMAPDEVLRRAAYPGRRKTGGTR